MLNARQADWRHPDGRGALCVSRASRSSRRWASTLSVLGPGEPMAMYHWEADQEDFLVLSGEAMLLVEGEERPLRQWDFVHCPPGTKHVLVGAGNAPCVVVAIGARERQRGADWGGYTVDEVARRHGASVEQETTVPSEAYAGFPARRRPTARAGSPASFGPATAPAKAE